MQMKEEQRLGEATGAAQGWNCESLSEEQGGEAGSPPRRDVFLGNTQNFSDPQLILLQNAITSIMVEAVGSMRSFEKKNTT